MYHADTYSAVNACLSERTYSLKLMQSFAVSQVAIQQAATDPVTGAIDMDLIQTGVSATERMARQQLAQEIKTLLISESPSLNAIPGCEICGPRL